MKMLYRQATVKIRGVWKALPFKIRIILVVFVTIRSLTWFMPGTESKDIEPDLPELKPLDWWESTTIYQIYLRSFKDSDGDGIGDLKGLISKLDHFVDAGVGTLWISPIFVSPMMDFGYDVSNYYDIHKEYGTMADFEELIQEAHKLGIKILLDFVTNHASIKSEYFKRSEARDSSYENFFAWADPAIDPYNASNRLVPSNWISIFGGSMWQWSEVRQQFYLHQFAIEQADFNFREPAVRKEMINIMRYWFEKGADGYRLDALPYLFEADPNDHGGVFPNEPLSGNTALNANQVGYTTQEYTKDLIEIYDVVYEWRDFADIWAEDNQVAAKLLIVEAYANITMTMLYYGNKRSKLGAHFPFNFDFIKSLSDSSNASDFVYVISHWLTNMPPGKVANWVFGNHDNSRLSTRFGSNMVDGMNSLSMMLPGVAVTYQGDELGMTDGYVSWEDTVDVQAYNQATSDTYMQFSRDPARTPYQWDNTTNAGFSTSTQTWLPIAQNYKEINLQTQKDAQRSHYKVYKSLASLRKEPALSHGLYRVEALSEFTLVLVRYLFTYDTYALVFNIGNVSDTVDLSSVPLLKQHLTVYTSSGHSNRVTNDTIPLGSITLEAGEALVLRTAAVTHANGTYTLL